VSPDAADEVGDGLAAGEALAVGVALAVGDVVALADVVAFGVVLALADVVAFGEVEGFTGGDAEGVAPGACLAETAAEDALGLALVLADVLGVALVLAVGDADVLGVALGLAEDDGDADPVDFAEGDVAGAGGMYGASSSTGRNLSCAVLLTRLMTSAAALPGTDTLIRSLPTCWTWAPELPVPLTRDSSTVMACCIEPLDGALPFGVCAFSTTWVPLDKSSPRPTLNCPCHLPGLNVSLPRTEISMIRRTTASAASERRGREPLLLGGATISCLSKSPAL